MWFSNVLEKVDCPRAYGYRAYGYQTCPRGAIEVKSLSAHGNPKFSSEGFPCGRKVFPFFLIGRHFINDVLPNDLSLVERET